MLNRIDDVPIKGNTVDEPVCNLNDLIVNQPT